MKLKRDWANLETLPLSLVLDKLEEHIDHVWFGAVCKNWQSIAKLNHENHQFKTNILPMLVISSKSLHWTLRDAYGDKNTWWLYGIPNKRCYPFLQFNQLCLANPKLELCGSSHGWFALVDDSTSIITLMNPFKDIPHIFLPPLNSVYKVTLSADPIKSPDDYMVAAIYDSKTCCGDGNLAFMRRGQTFWTYLDTSNSGFCDVIFYKGLLFAISVLKKIVSFNFGCSNDHLDRKAITSNDGECCFKGKYFVKSLEEELWIVRMCSERKDVFRVFKLQLDAKNEKVEQMFELKCLGDNILFLGAGDSVSVSASYFSKSLQRDSIYFASYLKIYNMKSESTAYHCPKHSHWMTDFWVLPHFEWNGARRLPHGSGRIRDEKMERGQQSTLVEEFNSFIEVPQRKTVRKGIRKRFPNIKLRDLERGQQSTLVEESNSFIEVPQRKTVRKGIRKRFPNIKLKDLERGQQSTLVEESNSFIEVPQRKGVRKGIRKRFPSIKLRDFQC